MLVRSRILNERAVIKKKGIVEGEDLEITRSYTMEMFQAPKKSRIRHHHTKTKEVENTEFPDIFTNNKSPTYQLNYELPALITKKSPSMLNMAEEILNKMVPKKESIIEEIEEEHPKLIRSQLSYIECNNIGNREKLEDTSILSIPMDSQEEMLVIGEGNMLGGKSTHQGISITSRSHKSRFVEDGKYPIFDISQDDLDEIHGSQVVPRMLRKTKTAREERKEEKQLEVDHMHIGDEE